MREFHLAADIKLLSINQAFIVLRNGTRCRSKEYTFFSSRINQLLLLKRNEFKLFNEFFNPKLHEVHAELTQYTDELYTKDGRISKNSGDLGNCEKCLTDCVLIGTIDDAMITSWSMRKIYRDVKGFEVCYRIVDR
ncbi:MAG: hypothetical protein RIQ94_2521 [Pseudomonadota bacterium]|jgi:hypothetical protein